MRVRSVLNNEGLATGYNITEVGLFATDPDTGSEILYAIIVAETGFEDYLPPHEDSPSSITMEIYLMLTEAENDVKFTAEVVAGTYASAEAFQEFVDNVTNGTTQVANAKTLDGHDATEVGASGARNLIPYPHYKTTNTSNGITWTDNGDGTVTVNGTATDQTYYHFVHRNTSDLVSTLIDGAKYTISDKTSTIVVINGLAITAGSNFTDFAKIGNAQPTILAIKTVTIKVKEITNI